MIRFVFKNYRPGETCNVEARLLDGTGEALIEADRFNPYNRARRQAFCQRAAEVLKANGQEVDPGEVERQFLEALQVQPEQAEQDRSRQLPSVILPDGRVAEQVYDPDADKVAFAVGGPDCGIKILECVEVGERIIEPVGGCNGDAFVTSGAVQLPSFQVAEVQPPRTAQVLAEVERFIGKYVGLRPDDLTAVACYVLLTWLADKADAIPYPCFRGDYGTGKSRALQVVGSICRRPAMISASPTPAVLFRLIEAWQPTLIIDEFNKGAAVTDDITAVLNAGYQRGATVLRCVGDENEPRPFKCYGPKLLATRLRMFKDDALESRLLVINMPGDKPDGIPTVLERDTFERETQQLRDLLCAWRLRYWHEFDLTDPGIDLPDLDYRYVQIITPLLAVAPPVQRARLRDWFVEHVARQIEEQSDRWTARIARIVVEHFDDPQADLLPIADIRSTLEAEAEDGERLDVPSAIRIGLIAKGLGLPKKRDPVTRRMVIVRADDVLKRLRRRYLPGRIDTPETLSTFSTLSDGTTLSENRTAVGNTQVLQTQALNADGASRTEKVERVEKVSGEDPNPFARSFGHQSCLSSEEPEGPDHPVDNSLADDRVIEARPAEARHYVDPGAEIDGKVDVAAGTPNYHIYPGDDSNTFEQQQLTEEGRRDDAIDAMSGRPHEKLQSGAEASPPVQVPEGWAPEDWADRLQYLGERCESIDPQQAERYRRQAEALRNWIKGSQVNG